MKRFVKIITYTSCILNILLLSLCFSDADGITGLFGKTIVGDETITTNKFSEYQFSKIKIGSSLTNVLADIGQPLSWSEPYEDGRVIGYWTTACCGGNYRIRTLIFKGEKLLEKRSFYDWD